MAIRVSVPVHPWIFWVRANRILRCLAPILLSTPIAAVTFAQPIRDDPRIPVAGGFPFFEAIAGAMGIVTTEPAGDVPNPKINWGSGIMVSECLMLTNNHVAILGARRKVFVSLSILPAQRKYRNIAGEVVRFQRGYEPAHRNIADWAVIRLARKVPHYVKPLVADIESMKGRPVYAAGIPADLSFAGKKFVLAGDPSCSVLGDVGINGWAFGCAVTRGMSGGGVFVTLGGEPRLFGLIVEGHENGAGHLTEDRAMANRMVPLAALRADLEGSMAASRCD